MEQVTLYHGDCLAMLKQVPDGCIDLLLTDPPYSSGGLFSGDRKRSTSAKYADDDYNGAARFADFSGDNMDQRSFTFFMREVFMACREKMAPGAIAEVFCDWRQLPSMSDALQTAGFIWRGIVVWDKGTARPVPGRFRNDCEYILWATNGQRSAVYVPGVKVWPGCYRVSSIATQKKHHQTEKPVPLLEQLMQIAPEGGLVCDPFMGSGSTGVACVHTGRRFIGIEMAETYYNTAKQRITGASQEPGAEQITIF